MAIIQGLKTDVKHVVPEALTRALDENVFVFSGLKAYHELKQASLLLKDENGGIKPYSQFKQELLKLHQAYNVNYLEAEYSFATSAAQMAAKWNDFEQDGDAYDLQFRTSGDEKVRASHQALHNTTLPQSDAFWNHYIPPLDWRCRCTVVQVRKNKYPASNSAESVLKGEQATTRIDKDGVNRAAMFRFNPGKQKVIFPEKHPYFKVDKAVKQVVIQITTDNKREADKARTKELKNWAKSNVQGKSVVHPEVATPIIFTMKGIKEYLNQPHRQYLLKNELIKEIETKLVTSKYKGKSNYHKENEGISYSHIFEIEINKIKSWLIAREDKSGTINFYGISDSNKVLKGVKKK